MIAIETLAVLEGSLPARVLGLVIEWGLVHRSELSANWQRGAEQKPLEPIPPLE